MQAKETKIQDIIEGTKQYVIPLFQRTYSWTNGEWDILWRDLVDLCEAENPGYPPKPGHPMVSITYCNSLLALPRPGQLINLC